MESFAFNDIIAVNMIYVKGLGAEISSWTNNNKDPGFIQINQVWKRQNMCRNKKRWN